MPTRQARDGHGGEEGAAMAGWDAKSYRGWTGTHGVAVADGAAMCQRQARGRRLG